METPFPAQGERRDPHTAQRVRREELTRLLAHPAIWRAGHAARMPVWPSGFPPLDEALPGGGWPRAGLIEILPVRLGSAELSLLMPALAAVTRRAGARWCAWIAPPLQPFAPALKACGVDLERLLIVRTRRRGPRPLSLWAFEQALGSGVCDVAFAWARQPRARQIHRLHLAAQRGNTLGVLYRPRSQAGEASQALLRVTVEALEDGARVVLLKSRGGARGTIDLKWSAQAGPARQA